MFRVFKAAMVLVAGVVAGGLGACTTGADNPGARVPANFVDSGYRGNFVPVGADGRLTCMINPGQQPPPSVAEKAGYQPCLHIAGIAAGMTRAEVEAALGPARRTVRTGAGQDARLYPIVQPGDGWTYWVIGYRDDRAMFVQLSGSKPRRRFSFSGIGLGDSAGVLVTRFGSPTVMEPLPENGELWIYDAWPIAFEIRDTVIQSIKVGFAGE